MRIAIGGDYAMNDRLAELGRRWRTHGGVSGLDRLRDIFSEASLGVVNFEAAFPVDDGPIDSSKVIVRANDESIRTAQALGIDAVSLANNHAFDFGPSVRSRLEKAGLHCFGGGRDEDEARGLSVVDVEGRKIGLIGWVDRSSIYGQWAAGASFGAHASAPDELVQAVASHRGACDHLVVLPHWGEDFIALPSPSMRRLALEVIDVGADAVIGTHPHLIGAMEWYRDRPIMYSTGSLLLGDVYREDGRMHTPCIAADSVVALLSFAADAPDCDIATFRCYRGKLHRRPDSAGWRAIARNSRSLHRSDYSEIYARYAARRRRWGIRFERDVLGRPIPALQRLYRRVLKGGLESSGPDSSRS